MDCSLTQGEATIPMSRKIKDWESNSRCNSNRGYIRYHERNVPWSLEICASKWCHIYNHFMSWNKKYHIKGTIATLKGRQEWFKAVNLRIWDSRFFTNTLLTPLKFLKLHPCQLKYRKDGVDTLKYPPDAIIRMRRNYNIRLIHKTSSIEYSAEAIAFQGMQKIATAQPSSV